MEQLSASEHTLQSNFSNKDIDPDINFFQISQAMKKLKEEILHLEQAKSQSIARTSQCTHDIQILHNLIEKMRTKIDTTFFKEIKNDPSLNSHEQKDIVAPQQNFVNPADIDWKLIFNPKMALSHIPYVHLRYALHLPEIIYSIKFSPDGDKFAYTDLNFLYLHNSIDGSLERCWNIQQFKGEKKHSVCAIMFSYAYRFLALGASNFSILIFDLKDYSLHSTLTSHTAEVSSLCFLHDDMHIISAGFDANIILWDLSTQSTLKVIHNGSDQMISSLTISADDSTLAAGFYDGNVGLFSIINFTSQKRIFMAHSSPSLNVCFSHNSALLTTTGQDGLIKIWTHSNKEIKNNLTLAGHTDFVLTSCFSPDDLILFSGSKDETIRAWNIQTGEMIWAISTKINTIFEIDHNPRNSSFLSCTGDGFILMWDYTL